ncbi:hypothetical protein RRG08_048434 [Elysia crispata]|uniref:Uncharacterized protein n=1 Tax=Elysia crispata TaxID=231223 RepID=A0AAE1B954_9GAST|nr:hypothetical protein RRG08_048434 [Elysia crispata]
MRAEKGGALQERDEEIKLFSTPSSKPKPGNITAPGEALDKGDLYQESVRSSDQSRWGLHDGSWPSSKVLKNSLARRRSTGSYRAGLGCLHSVTVNNIWCSPFPALSRFVSYRTLDPSRSLLGAVVLCQHVTNNGGALYNFITGLTVSVSWGEFGTSLHWSTRVTLTRLGRQPLATQARAVQL